MLNDFFINKLINNTWLYNISWEDPVVDIELLSLNEEDNVFIITSGGDNALTYLSHGVKSVTCVDLNPNQNYLLELKSSCIKVFSREDYFRIFGNNDMKFLKEKFHLITPYLSKDAKVFFNKNFPKTFIYSGASGMLAKCIVPIFKLLFNDDLLTLDTEEKGRKYYLNNIKKCKFIIKLLTNLFILTAPLQGVPEKQKQLVLNSERNIIEHGIKNFFLGVPFAKNYFYYPYAVGYFTEESCPEYMKSGNYEKCKDALLKNKLKIYTDTVENFMNHYSGDKFNKLSLLDHYDWMNEDQIKSEYESIKKCTDKNSLMLFRSAADKMSIDALKKCIFLYSEQVDFNKKFNGKSLPNDRVGMYNSVHVVKISLV